MITASPLSRRALLRRLGVGSAVLPFLGNLPSLAAATSTVAKKRLVIVFSPDGVVKKKLLADHPGPVPHARAGAGAGRVAGEPAAARPLS